MTRRRLRRERIALNRHARGNARSWTVTADQWRKGLWPMVLRGPLTFASRQRRAP